MADKFTVIVIQSNEKDDSEIKKSINEFIKSVSAKKGEARIAYNGNDKKIISTIDSFLSIDKLANKPEK
ncbi:MAG: hypothetical protein ABSA75_01645 [Candidatus Bathyarchaeia archaeon]|jgi:hypothetical protein